MCDPRRCRRTAAYPRRRRSPAVAPLVTDAPQQLTPRQVDRAVCPAAADERDLDDLPRSPPRPSRRSSRPAAGAATLQRACAVVGSMPTTSPPAPGPACVVKRPRHRPRRSRSRPMVTPLRGDELRRPSLARRSRRRGCRARATGRRAGPTAPAGAAHPGRVGDDDPVARPSLRAAVASRARRRCTSATCRRGAAPRPQRLLHHDLERARRPAATRSTAARRSAGRTRRSRAIRTGGSAPSRTRTPAPRRRRRRATRGRTLVGCCAGPLDRLAALEIDPQQRLRRVAVSSTSKPASPMTRSARTARPAALAERKCPHDSRRRSRAWRRNAATRRLPRAPRACGRKTNNPCVASSAVASTAPPRGPVAPACSCTRLPIGHSTAAPRSMAPRLARAPAGGTQRTVHAGGGCGSAYVRGTPGSCEGPGRGHTADSSYVRTCCDI